MAIREIRFDQWEAPFGDFPPGEDLPIMSPEGRKLWIDGNQERGCVKTGNTWPLFSVKKKGNSLECTEIGSVDNEADARMYLEGEPITTNPGSGKTYSATLPDTDPDL